MKRAAVTFGPTAAPSGWTTDDDPPAWSSRDYEPLRLALGLLLGGAVALKAHELATDPEARHVTVMALITLE